ncbi:hypothetical protein ACQE3E_06495 [Methylomonas sp. MED-D]|uniref:hypothetical protein n=1 Tax=Methylomonas sp. MED-D TaxID=3418768 RepID=UPI003D0851BB
MATYRERVAAALAASRVGLTNAELEKITGIAINNCHVVGDNLKKAGHAERVGVNGSLRWLITPKGRSYYAGLGIAPTDETNNDELEDYPCAG